MSTSSRSSKGDTEPATVGAHPAGKDETPDEEKDAPYYCPGCGIRGQYPQKCEGKPEAPHPPIEMVSTAELSGDPDQITRAPSTENLG